MSMSICVEMRQMNSKFPYIHCWFCRRTQMSNNNSYFLYLISYINKQFYTNLFNIANHKHKIYSCLMSTYLNCCCSWNVCWITFCLCANHFFSCVVLYIWWRRWLGAIRWNGFLIQLFIRTSNIYTGTLMHIYVCI